MTDPPSDDEAISNKRTFIAKCLFLGTVTGASILAGFGSTLALAKKRDPTYFDRGLVPGGGAALALRALGYGTLLATSTFGLAIFGLYALLGPFESKAHFRQRLAGLLPTNTLPPVSNRGGRTNFASLRDLVDHVTAEDDRRRRADTGNDDESSAKEILSSASALQSAER